MINGKEWREVAEVMEERQVMTSHGNIFTLNATSFEVVAHACDWGMAPRNEALREVGDVPYIAMASHSFGGRIYELRPGTEAVWIDDDQECFECHGWDILTEDNLQYCKCVSASSGSAVEARLNGEGKWKVTLTLPYEDDGRMYMGCYYERFMEAVKMERKLRQAA